MLPGYVDGFRRVTKPAARKLFLAGVKVWMLPKDANYYSDWIHAVEITTDTPCERTSATFEKFVNAFIYYNCPTRKTFPMFFVKEET